MRPLLTGPDTEHSQYSVEVPRVVHECTGGKDDILEWIRPLSGDGSGDTIYRTLKTRGRIKLCHFSGGPDNQMRADARQLGETSFPGYSWAVRLPG